MKNRSYIYILAAVLMAAIVTACGSDDGTDGVPVAPDGGEAIAFTISAGRPTRAFTTFEGYWTINQEMSICEGTTVCQYKAATNSLSSGEKVRVEPVKDEAGKAFFWKPTSQPRSFCAWYPYSSGKPAAVSVAADQRSLTVLQYNDLDLLYAPAVTVPYVERKDNRPAVDLTFYHQLCRVLITVNSTATKKSKPVTDIKLGEGNIAVSGTISELGATGSDAPGTRTQWAEPTNRTSTVTMRLQKADNTDHLYTYECVIPPQSLSADEVLFQITTTDTNSTTDTKTSKYIPSNMFTDAPDFRAGYQYNYSVTLSASGMVNISTVQVYDWSTENITGQTATIPDAGY